MSRIEDIATKVATGERLDEEDALALYTSPDLLEIGRTADLASRSLHQDRVFFNINRHINPTNICAHKCRFCSFSRNPGEEGAFELTLEEILDRADEAVAEGATEIHVVGGLHPDWQFSHYREIISSLHKRHAKVHLKAFTVVELHWMAHRQGVDIREILEELVNAGLGSLPGGGAEIFNPEVRRQICNNKISGEKWLDTHRLAHSLGLKSNCTMLYGHVESFAQRVEHLRALRDLQDETGGFNAFIPLAFQPHNNELGIDRYTFGYDDLKTIAVARLFLDNIPNIKAYWVMLGHGIAQLALHFGANDLDGTVTDEKISRMAGGQGGAAISRSYLENLIRRAGRQPVERDTLYRPIAEIEPSSPAQRASGEPDELAQLALTEDLHELGIKAADHRRARGKTSTPGFAPTLLYQVAEIGSAVLPTPADPALAAATTFTSDFTFLTLAIDLGSQPDDTRIKFPALCELVAELTTNWKNAKVTVRGFKALLAIAYEEEIDPARLMVGLKEAGAALVESSDSESETDLTAGEIAGIHRAAHQAGLATVAKLELAAPRDGSGPPYWDGFCKRLAEFAALHQETGKLNGLLVQPAPDSFITAVDFVRALAIATLGSAEIKHVATQLGEGMSITLPAGTTGAALAQSLDKVAPIGLHFGANDLGAISPTDEVSEIFACLVRSAGFELCVRDADFSRVTSYSNITGTTVTCPHFPRSSPFFPANEINAALNSSTSENCRSLCIGRENNCVSGIQGMNRATLPQQPLSKAITSKEYEDSSNILTGLTKDVVLADCANPEDSVHTLPPLPFANQKPSKSHRPEYIGPETSFRRRLDKVSSLSLLVFTGSLMGLATGITLGILVLLGKFDAYDQTINKVLSLFQ